MERAAAHSQVAVQAMVAQTDVTFCSVLQPKFNWIGTWTQLYIDLHKVCPRKLISYGGANFQSLGEIVREDGDVVIVYIAMSSINF